MKPREEREALRRAVIELDSLDPNFRFIRYNRERFNDSATQMLEYVRERNAQYLAGYQQHNTNAHHQSQEETKTQEELTNIISRLNLSQQK